MPSQFVVYAYPRTGSYHLTSLLDSCADIVCHGELFKSGRMELRSWYQERIEFATPSARDSHPREFLQKVKALNPGKHFGFKVFEEHARRVSFLNEIVKSPSWKRVILFRKPIETYASVLRAHATNIWTLRDKSAVADDMLHRQVRFDPESLGRFAQSYNHFLRRCRHLAQRPDSFVLSYDAVNDELMQSRLLKFIGSSTPVEALTSQYRRQFERPISEGFENWGDVEVFLAKNAVFERLPVESAA